MKARILAVLCILFSVNLMAITAENIRSTAVSHDGFTIRWEAVDEANGYEVDVKKGVYATVFETDFIPDSKDILSMPEGWESSENAGVYYSSSVGYLDSYCAFVSRQDAFILSPEYLNPAEFSFMAKAGNTSDEVTVDIEILNDCEDVIDTYTISSISENANQLTNAYKPYIYTPNSLSKNRIRIYYRVRDTASLVLLDDFSIEAISPDSSTLFKNTSATACAIRISSEVQPETAYIYRIKPNIADGEFSAWHVANTPAEDISSNSGSAIAGTPASINLSVGDSIHKLSIAPSSVDDADYLTSMTQELSSYSYSIQCEANAALNAEYTISHPGFTANEVYTNTGVLGYRSFEPGITTFEISGIAAKGELTITLNLEEDTLPVTLSYFNAFIMNPTTCRIDWTSQSESNLLGYRILRGTCDQVSEAMSVSSLIDAQNSSSTQHYSYRDPNPECPAYYWLVAVDMDTSEDIYGPVRVEMLSDTNPVEPDYHNDIVVFPNPMSHDATLQISTDHKQDAELRLYNLKGQLLRQEVLGTLTKGMHRLPFICQDQDGCQLPSGVYLLELRSSSSILRNKIVIAE